jgi:tRNA (cmo5U34)-methyltransferase
MTHFDNAARNWDDNPVHWERSEAVAASIQKMIPLKTDMTALEYGAGTGILSFLLHDKLAEITLMDSSPEMVKVIQEKIDNTGVLNMKPLLFDLENDSNHIQKFDLIINQMILHHVNDIDGIFFKFYNMLNPGGYLAIADLNTEDGSFHGEGFTGHKGFDHGDLAIRLNKKGFKNTSHKQCFVMKKQTDDGKIKEFPIFLLIALK